MWRDGKTGVSCGCGVGEGEGSEGVEGPSLLWNDWKDLINELAATELSILLTRLYQKYFRSKHSFPKKASTETQIDCESKL